MLLRTTTIPASIGAGASNWEQVEVQDHDNWRKELADAGSFTPVLAAERLVDQARFVSMVCDRRITWVISGIDESRQYPFLGASQLTAVEGERALWHTDVADPRFRSIVGCDPHWAGAAGRHFDARRQVGVCSGRTDRSEVLAPALQKFARRLARHCAIADSGLTCRIRVFAVASLR